MCTTWVRAALQKHHLHTHRPHRTLRRRIRRFYLTLPCNCPPIFSNRSYCIAVLHTTTRSSRRRNSFPKDPHFRILQLRQKYRNGRATHRCENRTPLHAKTRREIRHTRQEMKVPSPRDTQRVEVIPFIDMLRFFLECIIFVLAEPTFIKTIETSDI